MQYMNSRVGKKSASITFACLALDALIEYTALNYGIFPAKYEIVFIQPTSGRPSYFEVTVSIFAANKRYK